MSRRPYLWGVALGLLTAAMLAPWAAAALVDLAHARRDHAEAAGRAARPAARAVLLAPGLAFAARDAAGARGAMAARIQRQARAGGVLIEQIEAAPAPAGLAALRIRLSGSEKSVFALADAIQGERPVARFRAWRVVPAEGGGVRLSGEMLGAWR